MGWREGRERGTGKGPTRQRAGEGGLPPRSFSRIGPPQPPPCPPKRQRSAEAERRGCSAAARPLPRTGLHLRFQDPGQRRPARPDPTRPGPTGPDPASQPRPPPLPRCRYCTPPAPPPPRLLSSGAPGVASSGVTGPLCHPTGLCVASAKARPRETLRACRGERPPAKPSALFASHSNCSHL